MEESSTRAAAAAIGSVLLVSAVSLLGVATLSMGRTRVRRLASFFVAFAVGALLGDAFIHLIPETFGEGRGPGAPLRSSLLLLSGMLLFFVVEKLVRHRHGALERPLHEREGAPRPALVAINLLGDGLHNLIDGVLIGASYLVSPTLGVSTTLAVVLHEIPQELGDFGVLVHGGLTVRKAVLLNLASAGASLVGAVGALVVGAYAQRVAAGLLPVAAGGFVYLAAADLIPELQRERGLSALVAQTSLISAGIAVMGLLTLLG